jgi:predicted DsbA family dithiol-disulfide isomerase
MQVEVWSDVVCPWCYVGKRRLERALDTFAGSSDVQVVHRSFQLDPGAPRDRTRSRREMLKTKYRLSDEQVQVLDQRMAGVAATEGLEYRVTDAATGNTLDAHRLLHLARARAIEPAVLDRFYRAYFTEGRSLFDAAALTTLAVEAGLDEDEVQQVLRGDDYAAEVLEEQDRARALGVTGVPFFLIDDRHAIGGAQPVEVFRDALEQAKRHTADQRR